MVVIVECETNETLHVIHGKGMPTPLLGRAVVMFFTIRGRKEEIHRVVVRRVSRYSVARITPEVAGATRVTNACRSLPLCHPVPTRDQHDMKCILFSVHERNAESEGLAWQGTTINKWVIRNVPCYHRRSEVSFGIFWVVAVPWDVLTVLS